MRRTLYEDAVLKDGEQGAVLQRDGQTYAICPHLPCGLVTPEILRKIADVAERYGGRLKCTSAQRIAIVGLKPEDLTAAWADLGGENPGHMSGSRVRSVKACPGTDFCKRGRQPALTMGMELDRLYHGKAMPGKLKIGVSGCGNQCSETCIKDIGLVGGNRGWTILVGGAGGTYARLAKQLVEQEVDDETALKLVAQVIEYFEKTAQPGERLGDIIARMGMGAFRHALGVA